MSTDLNISHYIDTKNLGVYFDAHVRVRDVTKGVVVVMTLLFLPFVAVPGS